jgi:hypothetical protein
VTSFFCLLSGLNFCDNRYKKDSRMHQHDEEDELKYTINLDDDEDDMPVLTEEQLEQLTPPPLTNKYTIPIFYIAHSLTSWSDRMWYLAMPLVFAAMYSNTLLPVALFQFITQSICVVLGTYVGYFVDRKSRSLVMFSSIIVQNLAVCACSICLIGLLLLTGDHERQTMEQNSSSLFIWPFKTAPSIALYSTSIIFGAVSELAAMASSVSYQKDWAIIVAKSYDISLERK